MGYMAEQHMRAKHSSEHSSHILMLCDTQKNVQTLFLKRFVLSKKPTREEERMLIPEIKGD